MSYVTVTTNTAVGTLEYKYFTDVIKLKYFQAIIIFPSNNPI